MGKKKQFNETVVLEQIANHFWKHGFNATKVDQLSETTGLTKTSLYNAFGNKEALFLSSINFYVENSITKMNSFFDTSNKLSSGLEKILYFSFLDLDQKNMDMGCFLTNSIVELNGNDDHLHNVAVKLLDRVWKIKLQFISHYVDNNKLKTDYDAVELTNYYMTVWQGLRVQSRSDKARPKLKNSIDIFLGFIKSLEV